MGRPQNEREYTPEGRPYQGTWISELRHGMNKSVKDFAGEVSIDPASLSKIENNRARASRLLLSKIAGNLGIAKTVNFRYQQSYSFKINNCQ